MTNEKPNKQTPKHNKTNKQTNKINSPGQLSTLPDSREQLLLCLRKLHHFLFRHFQLPGSRSVPLLALLTLFLFSLYLPSSAKAAWYNTSANLVKSRCGLRDFHFCLCHRPLRWTTVKQYVWKSIARCTVGLGEKSKVKIKTRPVGIG